MKIATSILSSENYVECIKKLNKTNTDYIHIDTMDNIFVPNYKMPVEEVNSLALYTEKPFDIHLMMDNPYYFIEKLNAQNVSCISFHVEIKQDILTIIKAIKEKGYLVGLAIKRNTNLNILDKYLNYIDKVIIMSVEPGFGGQVFIENSIDRLKEVRAKKKELLIEIDGGINKEIISKIKNLVDIAVVGNYITKNKNYQEAINNLKN